MVIGGRQMDSLAEPCLVIALGLVGMGDAWRMSTVVRGDVFFQDIIGPDRYLAVLSFGLLLGGFWQLRRSLKTMDAKGPGERGGRNQGRKILLIMTVLLGYALTLPYLGYVVGTLMLFPFLYWMFGFRSRVKSIVLGVLTTAVFYGLFASLAEIPLPRGWWEIFF